MRRCASIAVLAALLAGCGWVWAQDGQPCIGKDAAPPEAAAAGGGVVQVWFCGCAKAAFAYSGGTFACPCAKGDKDHACKHDLKETYAIAVDAGALRAAKEGKGTVDVSLVTKKEGKEERTPVKDLAVKVQFLGKVKGFVCPMKCKGGESEKDEKCPTCGMKMKEGQVSKALGEAVEAKAGDKGYVFAQTVAAPGDYEIAVTAVRADKVELKAKFPVQIGEGK